MLSNRELAAEIASLAETLGVEVETEGLNKAKLQALHDELSEQLGQDEPVAEAEPTRPLDEPKAMVGDGENFGGPPPKVTNAPAPRFEMEVAPGKSIMSRRGMLREFEEVRADDFDGETLEKLKSAPLNCIRCK